MPDVADAIAHGPTGPGKCHDLDNFILCSTKTDFGLSPGLMTADERVEHAVSNPGLEDRDVAPWSTNGVAASVSTARAHSGTHSLAETGGPGTIYQDINGLQPGRTYTASVWVSAAPDTSTGAQIIIYNPSDNTGVSSASVRPESAWQRLSQSFTAGREGAVRIHLARGPGGGAVYWDDIHLSVAEAQ
jgi:hypothetical protein